MSAAPPQLPEKALRRVLAIAHGDGWSIVIVATLGAVWSLLQRDWVEVLAATLVVLAGAGELHGRGLLLRRECRGLRWLVGAQWVLLTVILAYAWWRWRFFDPAVLWAKLPALAQAEIDRQLYAAGMEPEFDRVLLLYTMNTLACVILALITLFYQGGLALYYLRQRQRIQQALVASPPPPLAAGKASLD